MLHYIINQVVPVVITAHQSGYFLYNVPALNNWFDAHITNWAFKNRVK